MALIFLDGFDKYGPANSNTSLVASLLTAGEWTAQNSVSSIVAPLSATGQAMQVTGTTGNNLLKTFSASYSRLVGGIRFSSALTVIVGIAFTDAGANQCGISVNTSGNIVLRNGAYGTGTVIATSAAAVTANSTHYLEWDLTFSNTGAYQLWLDGVSVLSGTADLTTTANNSANGFAIGSSTSGPWTVDDLYIFDTTGTTNNAVLLTSPRIETQFPTSDGTVQFAVGAGVLGTSWARATPVAAPAANSLILRPYTPVVACTLSSIGLLGITSGTVQYRPVVYADSSGAPGSLLSAGSTQVGVTTGVAKTLPLTTPQSLSAGVQYWLGYMIDISLNQSLVDSGTTTYRAASTFASGAPATAPAMTAGQANYSFWGNLSSVNGNWYTVSRTSSENNFSYVYEATVGEEDLYTYPALSAPPSAIYAVAVKASVAKSDAGAKTVSVRLKSGSTDSAGTGGTQAPGTSYGWLTSHYPTDPNGSVAWTLSALNAAQAGVKVES